MPVQFKNGKVLFRNGKVAMSSDCCCGPPPIGVCCVLDPPRQLYLTMDSVSAPGHPDAEGFGIVSKSTFFDFETGETSDTRTLWNTEEFAGDGDSVIGAYLACDVRIGEAPPAGYPPGTFWMSHFSQWAYFMDGIGTPKFPSYHYYEVVLADLFYDEDGLPGWIPLGFATCSPFYLEATVDVVFIERGLGFDVPEFSGTMRIIITE